MTEHALLRSAISRISFAPAPCQALILLWKDAHRYDACEEALRAIDKVYTIDELAEHPHAGRWAMWMATNILALNAARSAGFTALETARTQRDDVRITAVREVYTAIKQVVVAYYKDKATATTKGI